MIQIIYIQIMFKIARKITVHRQMLKLENLWEST